MHNLKSFRDFVKMGLDLTNAMNRRLGKPERSYAIASYIIRKKIKKHKITRLEIVIYINSVHYSQRVLGVLFHLSQPQICHIIKKVSKVYGRPYDKNKTRIDYTKMKDLHRIEERAIVHRF